MKILAIVSAGRKESSGSVRSVSSTGLIAAICQAGRVARVSASAAIEVGDAGCRYDKISMRVRVTIHEILQYSIPTSRIKKSPTHRGICSGDIVMSQKKTKEMRSYPVATL